MGILTRLRNAFGRSRKSRTAEAEGAARTAAAEPEPTTASSPAPEATLPSPSPEPTPARTASVPEPRVSPGTSSTTPDDEHDLVGAGPLPHLFDGVVTGRQGGVGATPKRLTVPHSKVGHEQAPRLFRLCRRLAGEGGLNLAPLFGYQFLPGGEGTAATQNG